MKFRPSFLTSTAVHIDRERLRIRPASADGDSYFGLEPGTNGTAAATRRACIDVSGSLTWERANGAPATGLNCVPTARSYRARNPWEG